MLGKFKKQLLNKGELYLNIKVRPNASKTEIRQVMDETIKINIAAPAVKNKANQELVKFLAKEFAISKNNVKLISGMGEPRKLVKLIK
ncbi:MAG: DUF167 domain-containing protein [bacterium]